MRQFQNTLLTKGQWSGYPTIHPFLNTLYRYGNNISNLRDIEIFIETGTHNGINAQEFSKYFNKVFTVELYPEQFTENYKLIKKEHNNIEFFSGSSPLFLKNILTKISERCVILLDAHGLNSFPLIEELDNIKCSSRNDHVIIIDDTIFFGVNGWPQIGDVSKKILEINPNYKIVNTKLGNEIVLVY